MVDITIETKSILMHFFAVIYVKMNLKFVFYFNFWGDTVSAKYKQNWNNDGEHLLRIYGVAIKQYANAVAINIQN